MKTKSIVTVVASIAFFYFIFMHQRMLATTGDDYILQVLFYMALSFSVIVCEEAFRRGISGLKLLAAFDFSLRVVTLLFHLAYMFASVSLYIANIITGGLFLLSMILQIVIYKKAKGTTMDEKTMAETVTSKELKRFLEQYYMNKLDSIGVTLRNELKEISKMLELSGKGNIVAVLLFVSIFASYLVHKHVPMFIIVNLLIIVVLLYFFIKLYTKLVKRGFNQEKNIKGKLIFENILFLIGFSVLFASEVFFLEKVGMLRVSVWFFSILMFCPILFRKFKIRERLKMIYHEVR